MAGEYSTDFVMDPEKYAAGAQNVNPFGTEGAMDYFSNLMSRIDQFDPSGFMKQFLASTPALQQLTTSATSDLAKQQQAYLGETTRQMTDQVAQSMSGLNSLYSSATPRLIGEQISPTLAQLNANLSQQRLGLFGGLGQTAMPLFAQGDQFGINTLSGPGMMGFITPNMVIPDTETTYQPGLWDYFTQGTAAAGNIAKMLATLGLV